MSIFKRSKLQNFVSENQKPRKINRNQTKNPIDILYSQGVHLIINNRSLLELKDDTILLSIDIFRNHLAKGYMPSKNMVLPLCICCLILAAKLNQVYPPKIDEIIEALQYFGEKNQVIKIEAYILKSVTFKCLFSSNIIAKLERNGKLSQQKMQQVMKVVFRCSSDPYFLRIQNEILSKALTLFIENTQNENIQNKSVVAVLKFIKQKTHNSGLRQRNLNKQNRENNN